MAGLLLEILSTPPTHGTGSANYTYFFSVYRHAYVFVILYTLAMAITSGQ